MKNGYRPEPLGPNLVKLMAERGVTQTVLAKRVGIAQPTIFSLMKGETRGTKYLVKIAEALGCTAEQLTNGTWNETGDTCTRYTINGVLIEVDWARRKLWEVKRREVKP